MATIKMTKRDYFNQLLALDAVQADEALTKFIEHELELLTKKNSADKKPTATQIANEAIKEGILEGMQENRLYTITELVKEIPACNDLTSQKVSAIVGQMVNKDNTVERVVEKRKAMFRKIV